MGFYDDLHPQPDVILEEDPVLDMDDLDLSAPVSQSATSDRDQSTSIADLLRTDGSADSGAPTDAPIPADVGLSANDDGLSAKAVSPPETAATASVSPEAVGERNIFEGVEETPSEVQTLSASLDPGISPVERSEKIIEATGASVIRKVLERLRAEDKKHSDTHNGRGFTEAESSEVVDKLCAEPARELDVLVSVLVRHVKDIYGGLYGLESHLSNPWVSDIMINGPRELFIEERGIMHAVPSPFNDAAEIDNFVGRLVGKYHLEDLSLKDPIRDWSFQYDLPDGTDVSVRVNAVLYSQSATGSTTISMRKPTTIGEFDKLNTWARPAQGQDDAAMTAQAVEFLRACIRHRLTTLVVGGTGSGKTSLLKALVNEFRPGLRILCIEESHELVLRRANAIGLVAHGSVDLAKLVASAMRMRPDVILIGEVRNPDEATQFLAAANTGHDGSITTTHASGSEAGAMRILNLINESGSKASLEYAGGQVYSGIDLIVFIEAQDEELPNGDYLRRRRVMEICTMSHFDTPQGGARFEVKPVFGRYPEENVGLNRRLDIKEPMTCQGFKGLSAKFIDKAAHFGLSEAALRALVDVPVPPKAAQGSSEPRGARP